MTRLMMDHFQAQEVRGAIRALAGLEASEEGVVALLDRYSPEWIQAALAEFDSLGQVDRHAGRVELTRDGLAHLRPASPPMISFYREAEQRRVWEEELERRRRDRA
jgi:hypothetical protein